MFCLSNKVPRKRVKTLKPTNYHINYNNAIKFATNMTKKGVYLPIILLETTVVAGRTYQAYKRGGTTEARERLLEESTGSFVWLGGAPLLFALGNKIAKKFGGIKNTNFDIGKDALRNPLEHIAKKTGISTGKLAKFKFANTLISVFAAAGFLGFVVPKLNQKLTKFIHKNQKQNNTQNQQQEQKAPVSSQANIPESMPQITVAKTVIPQQKQFSSMESFLKDAKAVKQDKKVAFKGLLSPSQIAAITQNLENHAVYKLATTDSVVITGRGVNARNEDERREILFRDLASTFFYLFASPLVIKGLTAADNKVVRGNTGLDPYSAMKVHNYLIDEMPKEKMTIEEFSKFAFGNLDENTFNKLKFDKDGIITLDKFKEVVSDKKLQEKALEMSKMQPAKDGISVLTKQQVKNILTDGKMSDPNMLKNVLNNIFGALESKEDVLGNPNKFIPGKEIEESTTAIQEYAKSIVEYAKKHKLSEITPETLYKVNKRNLHHRIGFLAAGFLTAAAFLSTIIPKVQYYITKVKTGSDKFPGAKNLDDAA